MLWFCCNKWRSGKSLYLWLLANPADSIATAPLHIAPYLTQEAPATLSLCLQQRLWL